MPADNTIFETEAKYLRLWEEINEGVAIPPPVTPHRSPQQIGLLFHALAVPSAPPVALFKPHPAAHIECHKKTRDGLKFYRWKWQTGRSDGRQTFQRKYIPVKYYAGLGLAR